MSTSPSTLFSSQDDEITSCQCQAAVKVLIGEMKQIMNDPIEGCLVKLADDSNMLKWHVTMFGPPGTLFQGAHFQIELVFPGDYPFSPPTVQFVRWDSVHHPNMYEDGEFCMSILFLPNDPRAEFEFEDYECWSPAMTVRSVLISVMFLLNYPDLHYCINYVAALDYTNWITKKDNTYFRYASDVAAMTIRNAHADGLSVHKTLEDFKAAQLYGGFLDCKVGRARDSDSDSDSSSQSVSSKDCESPRALNSDMSMSTSYLNSADVSNVAEPMSTSSQDES